MGEQTHRMRWRGVECVYTETEFRLIEGLVEKMDAGELTGKQVAHEWDLIQDMKILLDAEILEVVANGGKSAEVAEGPPPEDPLFRVPDGMPQ